MNEDTPSIEVEDSPETADITDSTVQTEAAADPDSSSQPELQEENERLRQELEQLRNRLDESPTESADVDPGTEDTDILGTPFSKRARSAVIIDDSRLIHIRFRSIIEGHGVSVVATSQNGLEAADLVAAHEPRLVVLDYNMPGTNGTESTLNIRKIDNQVKIFVVSGFLDAARIAMLKGAGVDDILVKPINEQKFGEAVLRLGI